MAEIYRIGSDNIIDKVSTFGGTNLLTFDNGYKTGLYGLSNCTMSLITDSSIPGKNVVRLTCSDVTKNAHCYLSNMKNKVSMIHGETYTATFGVKAAKNMSRPTNNNIECKSSGNYINNINITTNGTRQGMTFVFNESATYQAWYLIYPNLWSGLSNGDYIDIAGLKIEKGSKPTDGSPALEDLVKVSGTELQFFQ